MVVEKNVLVILLLVARAELEDRLRQRGEPAPSRTLLEYGRSVLSTVGVLTVLYGRWEYVRLNVSVRTNACHCCRVEFVDISEVLRPILLRNF